MELLNQSYELVDVSLLQQHPRNPRRGDVASISDSIGVNGFYGTVVVQRSTGNILAGNHRLQAARLQGATKLPVVYIDCDDDRALKILLADNRTNDLAGYDDEALAALLQELPDLSGTGYDQTALDELLAGLGVGCEGLTDEDAVPEVEETAISKIGDLWTLGKHRLICGDSTDAATVSKVLGGVKPGLMVTDPPYGVEYDPAWRNKAGLNKSKKKMGQVLNDGIADWTEAWCLFPGNIAYVWHAGKFASTVQSSLEAVEFTIRSQIIWVKDRFALSRGDYHWQHEPCWYAVKGTGNWTGDRSQSTTWMINAREDSGSGHGTQKPVECMRRPIANNSCLGQAVYDPFCGSGTTIIAAEKMRRSCFAIELNPLYVDLIVKRWQEFTGLTAVREDGKTLIEAA